MFVYLKYLILLCLKASLKYAEKEKRKQSEYVKNSVLFPY